MLLYILPSKAKAANLNGLGLKKNSLHETLLSAHCSLLNQGNLIISVFCLPSTRL
jgi:hypothetical protein